MISESKVLMEIAKGFLDFGEADYEEKKCIVSKLKNRVLILGDLVNELELKLKNNKQEDLQ